MPKKNWIAPNFEVMKLEKTKSGLDGASESRLGSGPTNRFNDAASSPGI